MDTNLTIPYFVYIFQTNGYIANNLDLLRINCYKFMYHHNGHHKERIGSCIVKISCRNIKKFPGNVFQLKNIYLRSGPFCSFRKKDSKEKRPLNGHW